MGKGKTVLLTAVTGAVLLAADQLTKYLAVGLHDREIELIPGVLSLVYLENRGAAFGIFAGQRWLFVIVSLVFMAGAAFYIIRSAPDPKKRIPCLLVSIIAAGALGNMIDRALLGFVRDFIYFKLIDFPVFNVADICVTVAAFLLVIWVFVRGDEAVQ